MGYDPYSQQGQPAQPNDPYGQSPAGQQYAPPYTSQQPASGQGAASPLPPELAGWNWGAFLLSWIWGLGNGVMIALLALIVPFFPIYLGLKGNELAWQNKQWDSVEQFKETQAKWTKWGVGLLVAWVVLVCVCVIFGGVLGRIAGTSG